MTCNNCNCQCNDEKYYQEWVPNNEYSMGDFFKIDDEVFKVVSRNGPNCGGGTCDFLPSWMERHCDNTPCAYGSKRICFILYDTLNENEHEA